MKKLVLLLFVVSPAIVSAQNISTLDPWEEEHILHKTYHGMRIRKMAKAFGEERILKLSMSRRVPTRFKDSITSLFVRCEARKLCYNHIYEKANLKRVFAKLTIDSIYRDSVNRMIIPHNKEIGGENMSIALYYSKKMELTESQHETLLEKAINISHKLYKDPLYNCWDEEMQSLSSTLSKDQLSTFFLVKHSVSILNETTDMWKKLQENGLTEGLDSAREFRRSYAYLAEKHKINDLYRHHSSERRAYVADLKNRRPKMIVLYEGIEKRRKIEEERRNSQDTEKRFVW